MTADRRPPDPTGAATTADFVHTLVLLRQWAGQPPLSRLRALGGRTTAPDGTAVDALPKSTTSHVLRQTGKLPRWDFVKAFVTACLRYCDYPEELIPEEVERWRAARNALSAPRTPPASTEEPPPDGERRASPQAAAPDAAVGAPRVDPALELLARRVAREEDRARKGLLSGYNIAPLSFGPRPDRTRDDGGAGEATADLPAIGRFFSGLRSRRLLVVGESGAGKTVLAIELVLQLVEPFVTGAAPGGAGPGDRTMVPVRVNAARWTVGVPFERWLAERLVQEFGLAARDAARLVRDRRVLPVVDGLDELDPEPSTGPPRRAIALLAELNRYSDLCRRRPGPVVVTCRTDRHAQLARARAALDDATVIHLHGLTVEQIDAYLRARWPDGHPCAAQRAEVRAALCGPAGPAVRAALGTPWRLLLTVTAVESGADPADLLHADPGDDPDGAPDGDPGDDPGDDYGDDYGDDPGAAAERIARRLLDAYVPAATELAPRAAHAAAYRPADVRRWLVRLADHLRRQAACAAAADRPPPGMTGIDIVPHLLWPIGGRRLVRALHGACCAVFAVVAMLAFWTGSAVDRPGDLRDGLSPEEGLTLALMAGWAVLATCLSLSPWPAAAGGRTNVPRRRRAAGGLLGALIGGPVGALGGLAGLLLTGGRVFGPGFAVAAGTAGGAVFGTVIGLTAAGRRGAPPLGAGETLRPVSLLGFGLCGALTALPPLRLADAGPGPLTLGVAGAFVLAFALGVIFTIATGGWSRDAELAHPREALHRNPIIGVGFGLTGGVAAFLVFLLNQDVVTSLVCALVGAVTFGLAFGAVAWSRAMIGLVVAAARGRLPLRLWTFLDWACEARLLRVSGATYQFRHRELQEYLTAAADRVAPGDGGRTHGRPPETSETSETSASR
ncbi:hypothetical protein Arub01_07820 [Actinomadura rubrobrunea]|uniref:NACHT domain-containing protein n=1 Tax=Actinomadura rubrobrunea TaxID=115335 RepID=A0A9W6UU69_9ACTN|nr:NACHT domain-containing protein [Actinomadura rubrobrunea]GLW62538.1 hypothetical protein Arub01_07820 [Actinomadura rubrobrunea]